MYFPIEVNSVIRILSSAILTGVCVCVDGGLSKTITSKTIKC